MSLSIPVCPPLSHYPSLNLCLSLFVPVSLLCSLSAFSCPSLSPHPISVGPSPCPVSWCMHVCMWVSWRLCMHVSLCVGLYVSVSLCVCVYVCVCGGVRLSLPCPVCVRVRVCVAELGKSYSSCSLRTESHKQPFQPEHMHLINNFKSVRFYTLWVFTGYWAWVCGSSDRYRTWAICCPHPSCSHILLGGKVPTASSGSLSHPHRSLQGPSAALLSPLTHPPPCPQSWDFKETKDINLFIKGLKKKKN